MKAAGNDRMGARLEQGWRLLRRGRAGEAADVFGRLLLQSPDHPEARNGLADARLAAAEEARRLEARLDDAQRAIDVGRTLRARRLLEDVVQRGGDRDRARALLDRLNRVSGRIGEPVPSAAHAPDADPAPITSARGWTRRAFVASWVFVFVLLATAVAAGWDRFVESLVRPPAPARSGLETTEAGSTP